MDKDSKHPLLATIESPADLKRISIEKLPQVCKELREMMIDVLSEHPGHFGSSFGVVELTVALHYIYDTPEDRIVWDVGHQAYSHKILTGRREAFRSLRQHGGISGFPNPDESEYDTFIAGHASNSISAALGMAVAAETEGKKRQIVAVIGDGSMTGGLAFEGLNNTSAVPNNLLIVLNDNEMAIDNNVGGLSKYLVSITTSQTYNRARYNIYRGLCKLGILHESSKGKIQRFNNSLKALLTNQEKFFEGFNIRYFGPVDGHDIAQLTRILKEMKEIKGPKLLHIRTKKGKGFSPAEEKATEWHAPGKFDKENGIRIKDPDKGLPPPFQDVFGKTMIELAKEDPRIVGITPAMPTGCSLSLMSGVMPDRVYDVGIAEEHAVTFSAGLAKEGYIPFCNIYSTFAQRAYDQIIHDVAMQRLPVIFCFDRAGLVGEDGMTHHGYFDLAAFRSVPNLTIAAPMGGRSLRQLMITAVAHGAPFIIRYPRGRCQDHDWRVPLAPMPIGKGRCLVLPTPDTAIALLSIGVIGVSATQAIEQARQAGIHCAHYDMIFLQPLDEEILEQASHYRHIITLENGVIRGGLGSAVIEWMNDHDKTCRIHRIGLPHRFIPHGTITELETECRMDPQAIYNKIIEINRIK